MSRKKGATLLLSVVTHVLLRLRRRATACSPPAVASAALGAVGKRLRASASAMRCLLLLSAPLLAVDALRLPAAASWLLPRPSASPASPHGVPTPPREHPSELRDPPGHTRPQLVKTPLPSEYVSSSELPASFGWDDVNGASFLTPQLNQHVPQCACAAAGARGAAAAAARGPPHARAAHVLRHLPLSLLTFAIQTAAPAGRTRRSPRWRTASKSRAKGAARTWGCRCRRVGVATRSLPQLTHRFDSPVARSTCSTAARTWPAAATGVARRGRTT